jgi:UDP-GlcNAc:undecaprenyl-phosphate GlcNAc-1-phosphate transferase
VAVKTVAVAFAASTLGSAVLTPAVRNLAHRWDLFDHALTSRKIHGKPVPRLGGIAIVAAFFAPVLALMFVGSDLGSRFYADSHRAFALFAGGGLIAALGIWDDLRGCGARTKFAVQFGAAALMYALGYRIDEIANPFGPPIELGIFGAPFTMLWIAGVVNAMNLIDGLDGLAGGIGFIAVITTALLAFAQGDPLMLLFTVTLAGALLGFLFHNFHPATIFMGDTGSMFIGFVLATTAIPTNNRSSSSVALLVPIIALGIPIADTLLAMARRAARGAPLFSGDRGHIHHRLLDSGLSHRATVLVMYGGSALLGAIAIAVAYANASHALLLLLALSGVVYLSLRRLGFLEVGNVQQLMADRERNLGMRAAVRRAGESLRRAGDAEAIWASVRKVARELGATGVSLRLVDDDGETRSFAVRVAANDPRLYVARYSILAERHSDDVIELAWTDGRKKIDRDTEIAVELLCDHVSAAAERIKPALAPLRKLANTR